MATKPKKQVVKWEGCTIKLRRATIGDRLNNAGIYRNLGLPTADDFDSFYAQRLFVSLLLLAVSVDGSLGFDLPKPDDSAEVHRKAFADFLALPAEFLDQLEPALISLSAWSVE